MWAFDGTTYDYCSKNWYDYTGQAVNTPMTFDLWGSRIHPDDLESSTSIWLKNLETKTEHNNYFRLKRYDGKYRYFYCHALPTYDKNGNFKQFQGYNIDITEQVESDSKLQIKNLELTKAKEKAEESERKLIEAQELAHIGSWEYFVDTDTVTWSKELFNIFERSLELPAPNYSLQRSFYTAESFAILDKAVQDCVLQEIPYEIELEIITSKGSKKTIISKGDVIKDENNKIIGSHGTAQDITQKKKIERELISAKEKAEESDRLKSAFLANMSHEIRTPMNGILGFSSLLKEPGLSGEEQQEYIQIIEQAGARMLNTINNIISISRIETGELSVSMSNTDINILMEDVYNFFNPQAEKKGLHFSVKASLSGKKAFIQTDREKVIAILFNLVKNAIKYTDNGSVEIGYNLKADSDPLELVFYVKDTGIGINENRQKAIFERFMQADIVDKDARQGSGLGLSISKAYIEVLGGKIGMESEKGHGSVFYFTLPYPTEIHEKNLTKNRGLEDVKEKQIDTRLSLLKILIAEDDENSEMYLRAIIKSLTKEILIAETGFEAIEACRDHPDIDLVLMDIQMPKMNGYEATREIRKFNKEIIIIAQTAFALAGDKEKAFEAGCNDYITKPVKKVELLKIIKKYFS